MNTKQIPILIVLLSAGISCVFSIVQKVPFSIFFKRFLITVLVFTVVGWIVKTLLDKAFNNEEEAEEGEGDGENPEGEDNPEGEGSEAKEEDDEDEDDL